MKKIMIVLTIAFMLFGCTKMDPTPEEETKPEPIVYETLMSLMQLDSVEIYDTIYLESLENLQNYELKTPIFDLELSQTLTWNMIDLRSSESTASSQLSPDEVHFEAYRSFTYLHHRVGVQSYMTKDFSDYLTSSFHEDMLRLEHDELTANQIFEKYGTHVIMSVISGYSIEMDLSIESNDLEPLEFEYILERLFYTRPIAFPITDTTYVALEAKSRILLNVETTQTGSSLEQVLNDLYTNSMPYSQLFMDQDIIPLHRIFGWDNTVYPHAIQLLSTAYDELFLTDI